MQSLSALLLSNDNSALRITNSILSEYTFNIEAVTTAPVAQRLIRRKVFDLAVYDQDTVGAIDLAASQAATGAPRVVVAMLGGPGVNGIIDKRVHFIVQKPFTAALLAKSVKAAYSLMLREKRAAFRHPVRIKPSSSTLIHAGGKHVLQNTAILNLSQTGMSLDAGEMVPQGATIEVSFPLPESNAVIRVTGTIIWVHESGRTGIKFIHVPSDEREMFDAWLDSMLPWHGEVPPGGTSTGTSLTRPGGR